MASMLTLYENLHGVVGIEALLKWIEKKCEIEVWKQELMNRHFQKFCYEMGTEKSSG